jgi:hypothetical protein
MCKDDIYVKTTYEKNGYLHYSIGSDPGYFQAAEGNPDGREGVCCLDGSGTMRFKLANDKKMYKVTSMFVHCTTPWLIRWNRQSNKAYVG